MTTSLSSRRWVLGLSGVVGFMVSLDTLVVATTLTAIHGDLGASVGQLEWVLNAYSLTLAVLLMTASTVGDRYGRRRVLVVGVTVFTLGSVASALAPDIRWLIAARALQGAGAAFSLPLIVALVGAAYPPERRGAAMGTLQGLAGVATACGPAIGGAVAQGLQWRWIFWINVPIGIAVVPLIATRVPESRGGAGRLDPIGVVLITIAVLGLVWGMVRGAPAGWDSPEVVLSLGLGATLLGGFVWWEARAPAPMLPLRLFASRAFAAGNAASFLIFAALFGAVFFMAQFLQSAQGDSPFGSGVRMLAWTGTVVLVAPLAGRLVDRFGPRPFIITGLGLHAVAIASLALVATPDVAYWQLVAPLVVAGTGLAMAMPAAIVTVVGGVAPAQLGAAAGTNSTLRQLGGVFGVALAVAIFSAAGGYGSAAAFSDGFVAAMTASAGLALVGVVAGLILPARRAADRFATGASLPQGGTP